MTNIPKPMNPYAETDFDQAVDNALDELARKEAEVKKAEKAYLERCGMESVADEMKMQKETKEALGQMMKEVNSQPLCIEVNRSSIVLKLAFREEWMSMMKMLTENGYDFEVHTYPSLKTVEISWRDK